MEEGRATAAEGRGAIGEVGVMAKVEVSSAREGTAIRNAFDVDKPIGIEQESLVVCGEATNGTSFTAATSSSADVIS